MTGSNDWILRLSGDTMDTTSLCPRLNSVKLN